MLDRLVHSLNLPIGLRPHDRREDLLDMEVVAKLLEFITVELCSIVGYDGVRDSVPADYVFLYELLNLCGRDGRKCFCFNLFSVVNNHYCILHTTSSFEKSAN